MLKRETRLGDTAPGLLSHAFYRRTNPKQSSIIEKKTILLFRAQTHDTGFLVNKHTIGPFGICRIHLGGGGLGGGGGGLGGGGEGGGGLHRPKK